MVNIDSWELLNDGLKSSLLGIDQNDGNCVFWIDWEEPVLAPTPSTPPLSRGIDCTNFQPWTRILPSAAALVSDISNRLYNASYASTTIINTNNGTSTAVHIDAMVCRMYGVQYLQDIQSYYLANLIQNGTVSGLVDICSEIYREYAQELEEMRHYTPNYELDKRKVTLYQKFGDTNTAVIFQQNCFQEKNYANNLTDTICVKTYYVYRIQILLDTVPQRSVTVNFNGGYDLAYYWLQPLYSSLDLDNIPIYYKVFEDSSKFHITNYGSTLEYITGSKAQELQLGGICTKVFDPFAFDGGSDIKNSISSYANFVRSSGYYANVILVTHKTMRDVPLILFVSLMTIATVCLSATFYAFFRTSDFYTVSFYDLAKASQKCDVKENSTIVSLEIDNDIRVYRIMIEETQHSRQQQDGNVSRGATAASQRVNIDAS